MAKQIKELRNFISGTNSAPSAVDVPDETPVYSLNIESLDEEGKLKGVKTNIPIRTGDTQNAYKIYMSPDIITGVPLKLEATVLDVTTTKDCGTPSNATHFTQKTLRKSFAAILQGTDYVQSATLKSGVYSSTTGWTAGTHIDTAIDLPEDLTATEQAIDFTSGSPDPAVFVVGETLKIGNSAEILLISSIVDPENSQGFTINVERGHEGTTATTHTTGDDIKALDNWNILEVVYVPQIESIVNHKYCSIINGVTSSGYEIFDDTSYFEINARNLTLLDRKDENSTITTNDVAFYNIDKTVTPNEYKMKIIENFYKDNNGSRGIVEPINTAYINSSNTGYPESVTLAKGPNAVYIGSGATASSKAQWLGRVNHSQFGEQINGYILEDSKLTAIDDGNAIFSLSYMDLPHTGASSARANNKFAVAMSNDKRYLYGVNFRFSGSQGNASVGKQRRTEDLGYTVSGIGSSKKIHEHMKANGDKAPIVSGNWDGTNDNTTFAGHDANYATYMLVGKLNTPDVISVVGCYYHYDSNDEPEAFIKKDFGDIKLTHHIEIDADLASCTGFTAGDKINRPPKGGSYINDIYEKNGTVYIQYGHNSGFSFDEEYLYCFDISLVLSQTESTLGSITVNAKPITPPVVKLKNFGNDYRNAGQDWYVSEECSDFSGLNSESWIGQSIPWGNYSNYVKWRNIDMLGFTKDLKHGLFERELYIDESGNGSREWVTVQPDTGNWNINYGESTGGLFSGGDPQNTPGYTKLGTFGNTRTSTNPKVEIKNRWDDALIAPTFGFETFSAQTITGGIVNLATEENANGEIGCQVFVDGKRVDSQIRVKKSKSDYQSWFTYKRRHYYYNSKTPSIKNINEMMVFTTDKQGLGVAQRVVPYEYDANHNHSSHRSIDDTDAADGTYVETDLKQSAGFRNLNGADTSAWSNSNFETDTIDWGDGAVKKPMKYAWRYGCYSSGRMANSSTYVDKRNLAMLNHNIVILDTLSTTSTDSNTSFPLRPGDLGGKLRPPVKNYTIGNVPTRLINTSLTADMDANNTYLSRWNILFGTETSAKINYTSISTLNPMVVMTLGSAVAQDMNNNGEIYLVPTTTTNSSGRVDLNQSSNTWESATAANGYTTDPNFGTYYEKANAGDLGFGLVPTYSEQVTEEISQNPTVYATAPFMAGNKYYYKLSMLYDGFQEGPLSDFEFVLDAHSTYNHKTVLIDIEMNVPPKRVSDIILYRKANANEYYKMVKEVSLSSGWAYDSIKDVYKKLVVDEGNSGATYEAINGVPETLRDTSVNYTLSTVAQGHLVVADCYHPELKQGQNFILKSEPDAFSVFNWTKNFCILPTKPTAITWFAGKIYAFDLNNMYRISLDNLVLEDTFEGVGCISQDSLIVTDMGMFFCDYQGLYWHNGQKAENISMPILTSSQATDTASLISTNAMTDPTYQNHAWQDINHISNPKLFYDPRTLTVFYCFQDQHKDHTDFPVYNGAWKFNLTRKRLDLMTIPEPLGVFSGNRNDSYISGESKLFQMAKGYERLGWSWRSKKFDMQISSQDKTFYAIHLKCNNVTDATNFYNGLKATGTSYGNVQVYVNENGNSVSTTYDIKDSIIKVRLKGSAKTGSFLQVYLASMKIEIDSISIIFRPKRVKS